MFWQIPATHRDQAVAIFWTLALGGILFGAAILVVVFRVHYFASWCLAVVAIGGAISAWKAGYNFIVDLYKETANYYRP